MISFDNLMLRALQVLNARLKKENTSTRIGSLFQDILLYFNNLIQNAILGIIIKGEKANEEEIKALPDPAKGDTYKAIDTKHYWTYDGTQWNDVGEIIPSNVLTNNSITTTLGNTDDHIPAESAVQKALQDVLKEDSLLIQTVNWLNPKYIRQDVVIASDGTPTDSAGGISVVNLPVSLLTYTLSGYTQSGNKSLVILDVSGIRVYSNTLAAAFRTLAVPSTGKTLSFTIKLPSESSASMDIMLNEGGLIFPYQPYDPSLIGIGDAKVSAISLQEGNTVPTPVNPENAVNKQFFDANAVVNNDLEVQEVPTSTNRANPANIIDGQYINNAGGINTASGWKMIAIPVTEGKVITFGRFSINTSGYSAFYNESGLVLFNGNYTNSTLPKTVTAPAGATILYIDIKRPVNVDADFEQLTVNEGSVLLPYEPYSDPVQRIGKIKGIDVGGSGEAYDQSLNTTDNVSFEGLTTNELSTGVFIANLPEGTTEPAGLRQNQAWIDTTNGQIKVKL
ncbi:MAG: hypothetical protein ACK5KT_15035 [Dysgonomonas sp.]